jgi:regulator of sigma E protease
MIDVLAVLIGLVLTFLIVVIVHELGHFFAARLVGVKAAVFSIGFGKPIWTRTDRRGVLWQVTRIPAGGYVKFVGDENAASLSSSADGPVLAGSLRSVSKTAQAVVAIAGPVANVMLTVALLSVLPFFSGVTTYPWTIDDVAIASSEDRLQSGDTILSIDGADITPQDTLGSLLTRLPYVSEVSYRIERNGAEIAVSAPRPDLPLLGYVADGSPADLAGLAIGDQLMTINGLAIHGWADLQEAVAASAGEPIEVIYLHGGSTMVTSINPQLNGDRWLIGVSAQPLFSLQTESPALIDALGQGATQSWDMMRNMVTGLAGAAIGQNDSCDLDGPIAIASVAGQAIQLGPETFILFLAVISLGLGILNLLPVPILDGGHLMMLGYEGLTGRPLGTRMQGVVFIAGVTMIVFLMLTATINDLTC